MTGRNPLTTIAERACLRISTRNGLFVLEAEPDRTTDRDIGKAEEEEGEIDELLFIFERSNRGSRQMRAISIPPLTGYAYSLTANRLIKTGQESPAIKKKKKSLGLDD